MSDTALSSASFGMMGRPGYPSSGLSKPPSRGTPITFDRPTTRDNMETPSGEKLTPMPEYMRPIEKSAQRKWKKLHEDHMMNKLLAKRNEKKQLNNVTKEEAMKICRKIPMEILAKDWLGDNRATIETRAYLVDKCLPTLILGVEKLLMEVDRRRSNGCPQADEAFNPVNFLAQYLMRNNPRYSNFSEASPYVRGLREIGEDLRKQLFDIEENKLVRIKADARRKREDREYAEHMRHVEKTRRTNALRKQFNEWNIVFYPNARIELALLQNALLSFVEVTELYPEDLKKSARLSQELESTDDTGKTVNVKEFVQYLSEYVEDLSAEVFDHFLRHLSHCALAYRIQAEREQRRVQLTQLFVSIDNTGVGLVDRHRILNLFEMFYDKARELVRNSLRNPRRWPVVDMNEVDMASLNIEDDHDDDSPRPEDTSEEEAEEKEAADDTAAAEEPEQAAEEDQDLTGTHAGLNQPTEEAKPEGGEPTEGEDKPTEEQQETTAAAAEAEAPVAEGESPSDESSNERTGTAGTTDTGEVENVEAAKTDENPEQKAQEAAEEAPNNDEGATTTEESSPQEEKTDKEGENVTSASTVAEGEPELAKLVDSGDALPQTADTGDKPPRTQQSKVSFADGTTFERERTMMQSSKGSRSHSAASAFDENTLNTSQFVSGIETFLGDEPRMEAFHQLIIYIREGYMETEDERMSRLIKARQEAQVSKRKALLNSLFEMWDNDGSGFLDLTEIVDVMNKYKDGIEMHATDIAKKDFKKRHGKGHDGRLTKREFRDFVYKVVENMAGTDDFDYFIDFMLNSVERTYAERVRGEARKKWLHSIVAAGETSGVNMEPVYKAVFQALYKDAEAHGNNKTISAYIAMLEPNEVAPPRGDSLLRYVAATPESAPYVLGKALFKDMKGISFASVESGKPIHVPRVANHGNIYFWNHDLEMERDGSFITVPLKDRRKRVFGLLCLDTLNDPHSRAIFITHEIQFFQGIAKAFSISYHNVDVRQKTIRISESAVSWIHRRSPHVTDISVYMVEPDGKGKDYILRKMMVTGPKRTPNILKKPPRLERKDNLFRDYLFKCVDNSESVTADAYGERHMAIPLRDDEGLAIVVVDIAIGSLKSLPRNENREVMKMLKLLQMAYKEIARESRDGERADGQPSGDNDAEILFDRLMLLELKENVSKLDQTAYAELKSYQEPPLVIHQIIRSVLSIFHPQLAKDGEFDNWSNCKQYVTLELSQRIITYDPTNPDDPMTEEIPVELIHDYLDDVPHGQVHKVGSIPAQFLYNWVFVCGSLIEHSRKMRRNKQQNLQKEEDNIKKENTRAELEPKSRASSPDESEA